MTKIAAVVLAAGASTRMGQPKQLLTFRGKTLVEHVAREALLAEFEPVVVVVGAGAEAVRAAVANLPVAIVENEQWESGMGTSISAGVRASPGCDGVAILLVDQPLVTAAHLREMRGSFCGDIVAARYNERLGVPAIFPKRLFGALTELQGHEGARSLLRSPDENVIAFDLPEAGLDVDTPGDWRAVSSA
ncbi:MAG TPA: nucleotidyltransferase family protein [Bryobacteraceae bacterium]|nr:nucleotidyltransferase family protein [Bryobacteraceae bacterium]